MGWVKIEKGVDSFQGSNPRVTGGVGEWETREQRNLQNGESGIAPRRGGDRGGKYQKTKGMR